MIARLLDLFRTPTETLRTGGRPRSPGWPATRKAHLIDEPHCQACGGTEALQVHHVLPFWLYPELELEPHNLLTLCEARGRNCHFTFGHLYHWSQYNAHAREDAARQLARVRASRTTA